MPNYDKICFGILSCEKPVKWGCLPRIHYPDVCVCVCVCGASGGTCRMSWRGLCSEVAGRSLADPGFVNVND